MALVIANRFSLLSKICLLLAFLCLMFGVMSIAFASVTPLGYESICVVGVSGMSPHVEIALIEEGVYSPSPKIIAMFGKQPANYSLDPWYDPDYHIDDWLWFVIPLAKG